MAQQTELKGRDCPICNKPDMEYIGKMGRPLYLIQPILTIPTKQINCEIYHCKRCNHLEWKEVDKEVR